MKKLSEIKLTKNQKYAMYFGGAVLGTIIIFKIIKAISDKPKGGDSVVTQTVYTDKYLSGLPLDVDKLTWASKVPTKYLPKYDAEDPLYIGFFHTGAYQESIGGYGGIQHCLTPAPKHVIIDRDENGDYYFRLFSKEQSYKSMLKTLGYM
jgi:hypothetical protein